jgi:hypothetical protein
MVPCVAEPREFDPLLSVSVAQPAIKPVIRPVSTSVIDVFFFISAYLINNNLFKLKAISFNYVLSMALTYS